MKKSLTRLLARMAKDGDAESVAEFIEEMISPETETPAESEAPAVAVAIAQTEPNDVSVPAEAGEGETAPAVSDSEPLAAILERLDRLIALLTPAVPAADNDPEEQLPEELAEVIEETLEAIEAEAPAVPDTGETAEAAGEVPDPAVSTVIEPDEEDEPAKDCGTSGREAADTLRASLAAIRPELMGMPRAERRKACRRIAARLSHDRASDPSYAALLMPKPSGPKDSRDLGRRIMAKRNPNYKE